MGIITKCDALQDGYEAGVVGSVLKELCLTSLDPQNCPKLGGKLNHGWFAVKNRSTKEIQDGVTIEQRHANEKKLFETPPWNQLPKDRVGIPALKMGSCYTVMSVASSLVLSRRFEGR